MRASITHHRAASAAAAAAAGRGAAVGVALLMASLLIAGGLAASLPDVKRPLLLLQEPAGRRAGPGASRTLHAINPNDATATAAPSVNLFGALGGLLQPATAALEALLLAYGTSAAAVEATSGPQLGPLLVISGAPGGGAGDGDGDGDGDGAVEGLLDSELDLDLALLQLRLAQLVLGDAVGTAATADGEVPYDGSYDSLFGLSAGDAGIVGGEQLVAADADVDADASDVYVEEAYDDADVYDSYDLVYLEADDVQVSGGDIDGDGTVNAAATAAAAEPRATSDSGSGPGSGPDVLISRRRRQLLAPRPDGDGQDQGRDREHKDAGPRPRRSDAAPARVPRRDPADRPPANVWVPGIVRVTRDGDGDVKVRVGPLGAISSVTVNTPDNNARQHQQSSGKGDSTAGDSAAIAPYFRSAVGPDPPSSGTSTAAAAGVLPDVTPASAVGAVVGGAMGTGVGAAVGGPLGAIASGAVGRVVGGAVADSVAAVREAGGGGGIFGAAAGDASDAVGAAAASSRSGLVNTFGPDPEEVLQQSSGGRRSEEGGGGGGVGGGGADQERKRPRVAVTVGPAGSLVRTMSGNEGSVTKVGLGGGIARAVSMRP